MNEAVAIARVLAHVDAKTTDAEGGATTVPVETYLTDDAALFTRVPVAIGHSLQLRDPGQYLTHDSSGRPLLVVRDESGALRAHLNVCRHRGTRLESAPCGTAKAFRCPYHAWTYDQAGTLIGIPHEKNFVGSSRLAIRGERNLVSVPVVERAGLVFVQGEPALGELEGDLVDFGLATGAMYAERTIYKNMDWKLAIDVFLETYHLRSAHANTIYRLFFDNIGLVDRIGPHMRNVFPKRSIVELRDNPQPLRNHANILFHLFPNTFILVEPDHSAVLHLWPAGPGRTRLDSYAIIPEPAVTEKAKRYWDANMAILNEAIDEDFAMGESIQRGLASGANREVVFGAFEHALTHFHAQVAHYRGAR